MTACSYITVTQPREEEQTMMLYSTRQHNVLIHRLRNLSIYLSANQTRMVITSSDLFTQHNPLCGLLNLSTYH